MWVWVDAVVGALMMCVWHGLWASTLSFELIRQGHFFARSRSLEFCAKRASSHTTDTHNIPTHTTQQHWHTRNTMHTVWVRLNAVVFFGLTILLGLSILAGLSKIGHSDRPSGRPVITKLGLNGIKSLKNHGGVDRALLSFDLHVSVVVIVIVFLCNGIFISHVIVHCWCCVYILIIFQLSPHTRGTWHITSYNHQIIHQIIHTSCTH